MIVSECKQRKLLSSSAAGYHSNSQIPAPEANNDASGAFLHLGQIGRNTPLKLQLGDKVGHQLGHVFVPFVPEFNKTIHSEDRSLQPALDRPYQGLEAKSSQEPKQQKSAKSQAVLKDSQTKTNHFKLLQSFPVPKTSSSPAIEHFLKVSDFAQAVGVSAKTVTRWCESGRLPAFPKKYGRKTTYLVPPSAIETVKKELEAMNHTKQKESTGLYLVSDHSGYVSAWESAMRHRLIPGKKRFAYSARTIKDYLFYVSRFLETYKLLSLETLKQEISSIPEEQVPTKEKTYKALVCLAKYLIAEKQLDESFLEQASLIRPTAVGYSPKRLKVNTKEVRLALRGAKSITDKLLIRFLATTGLRAAEATAVIWGDINLETGELFVRRGKGGKSRTIGIPKRLATILTRCKEQMQPTPDEYVFLTTEDKPFSPINLSKRISRIGKRVGIELTPHSLRRYFVTSNAKKGVPMPVLQLACGHSNIKITMAYCQMDESDVVRIMRALD